MKPALISFLAIASLCCWIGLWVCFRLSACQDALKAKWWALAGALAAATMVVLVAYFEKSEK